MKQLQGIDTSKRVVGLWNRLDPADQYDLARGGPAALQRMALNSAKGGLSDDLSVFLDNTDPMDNLLYTSEEKAKIIAHKEASKYFDMESFMIFFDPQLKKKLFDGVQTGHLKQLNRKGTKFSCNSEYSLMMAPADGRDLSKFPKMDKITVQGAYIQYNMTPGEKVKFALTSSYKTDGSSPTMIALAKFTLAAERAAIANSMNQHGAHPGDVSYSEASSSNTGRAPMSIKGDGGKASGGAGPAQMDLLA